MIRMEFVPTGLFRQLTQAIRAMPGHPTPFSHAVEGVAPGHAIHSTQEHNPQPLAPEILRLRESYLKAFELLHAIYEDLRKAELSPPPASARVSRFVAASHPDFAALQALFSSHLAETPLARETRARLTSALLARDPGETSLFDAGMRLQDPLAFVFPPSPLPEERLAGALYEACHGERGLAAALIVLAAEAWGCAINPAQTQLGYAWGVLARNRWVESERQSRARLFNALAKKLQSQGLRIHDLE